MGSGSWHWHSPQPTRPRGCADVAWSGPSIPRPPPPHTDRSAAFCPEMRTPPAVSVTSAGLAVSPSPSSYLSTYFSPHRGHFSIAFREEGGERNVDWLPPLHAQTRDHTPSLSVTGLHSNQLSHGVQGPPHLLNRCAAFPSSAF